MKLVAINFLQQPRIHPLPTLTFVDLTEPGKHGLAGFAAFVRGPSVFLVSPPGWKHGVAPHSFDEKGLRAIFEIPRAHLELTWSGSIDEIENVQKYSPSAVLTDEEMERATNPQKGKSK